MIKLNNERGEINVLLIPLIAVSLLFFGALGFGAWAYMGMEDYKTNVQPKIDSAVAVAVDKNSSEKDNEFQIKEKQPYRTFKGSDILGAIVFEYPKTWSGSLKQTDKDLTLLMQPGIVDSNQNATYPLKVEVVNQPYDTVIKAMESNVKAGKSSANAFRLERLPNVLGTRFDGELRNNVRGSMIVLPMREKTVKISSEVDKYIGDLNTIILPAFTFTP